MDGLGLLLLKGAWETIYITCIAGAFAYCLGLPIGILLAICKPGGLRPAPVLYRILDLLVNLLRSVPFLILLVAVIPFTRLIVGTSIGSIATIPPLVIASAPFIARLIESSLLEVDAGVVEAATAMGCTVGQIICKVMLPEALPSLLNGAVIALTTILSYSAMAGFTGGGGLGAIAVNYGYYRYQSDVMLYTVIILILIVQAIQSCGALLVRKVDKRR